MGRALYTEAPSADAASAWGFTVDEVSGPPQDIWPDNLLAVNTFIAAGTQWRVGAGGPIGLDYNALPNVMRLTGVPRAQWKDVFQDIRTLEGAALETMHKK